MRQTWYNVIYLFSNRFLVSVIHPLVLPVVWHRATPGSHQPSWVLGPEGRPRCCTTPSVQIALRCGLGASGRCRSRPQWEHTVQHSRFRPGYADNNKWVIITEKKTYTIQCKCYVLTSCQRWSRKCDLSDKFSLLFQRCGKWKLPSCCHLTCPGWRKGTDTSLQRSPDPTARFPHMNFSCRKHTGHDVKLKYTIYHDTFTL